MSFSLAGTDSSIVYTVGLCLAKRPEQSKLQASSLARQNTFEMNKSEVLGDKVRKNYTGA